MTLRYRCTKRRVCGARVSLPKPIERYTNQHRPKCPGCGRDSLKKLTERQYDRSRTCDCGDVPFPHRRGAKVYTQDLVTFCAHYEQTIADQEEAYSHIYGPDEATGDAPTAVGESWV